MTISRRVVVASSAAFALAPARAQTSKPENYPQKPVTLIVPFEIGRAHV